ncbi:MAG: thiamine-phosphate kinase [Acidobacteriia bacterium]|nr:thiamine-phosphate kinase [Terriglobia bacterium]
MVQPERKLIERIRRMAGSVSNADLVLGIGDDCAILRVPSGFHLLVTTDFCIEDVHFRRAWHPASSVGHHCLARGLSDIAAMGGEPVACFLSLGLPRSLPQPWLTGFLRGLMKLAREFRVPLAGGDTSSAEKIMADIVVVGKAPSGKALLRSGAQPGDGIFVTGELGGSAATLQRLYNGEKIKAWGSDRHFYPQPRLEAGQRLREKKLASAAIDLSDGLSVDLRHICEESRVTAIVESSTLPIAARASLQLALHGGEDYELLFTAPRSARIPAAIAGVPVTRIGEIQGRSGKKSSSARVIQIRDAAGRLRPLEPAGWEHFRKI